MLQSVVIDSNADALASTTRIPLTLVSAVGLFTLGTNLNLQGFGTSA